MPSKESPTKPKPSLPAEWSFEAIGTHWWIGTIEPLTQGVKTAVAERIANFDQVYSRFRPDSLVAQMHRQAGSFKFPGDAGPLFSLYRQLYDLTDGQMTPLIGQLLADAGYDASYSLQPKMLHDVPAWDDALSVVNTTITTKSPILLDIGAVGKGYLVDLVSEVLTSHDVEVFCVDAGGDMRCSGLPEPLRIGLENPSDTAQAIGVTELGQGALCASAGSRRAWGKFNHIMDPRLKQSPGHIAAVWVQADTAMLADGLTTALYFTDPAALLKHFRFEYLIMYSNNSVKYSAKFPAELFAK